MSTTEICCKKEKKMQVKQIVVEEGPKAIGPYSVGMQVGEMIYLSGQIPVDGNGEIVESDISIQTKQSIENIEAILKSQNLDLSNVIKTTVFLSDMNNFVKMNQMYAIYFSHPYPARSCVEVARLPKDVLVEIECIVCSSIERIDDEEHCLDCDE